MSNKVFILVTVCGIIAAVSLVLFPQAPEASTLEEDYKACRSMAIKNSGALNLNANVDQEEVVELIRSQCGMTHNERQYYAGEDETAKKRCAGLPEI